MQIQLFGIIKYMPRYKYANCLSILIIFWDLKWRKQRKLRIWEQIFDNFFFQFELVIYNLIFGKFFGEIYRKTVFFFENLKK